MYLQFREWEKVDGQTDAAWISEARKSLRKSRWAICSYLEEGKTKIGVVLLDLPKVPWYQSQSPMICFMTNDLLDKHMPKLVAALEKVSIPQGTWHLNDLGVDHTNLLAEKYAWRDDLGKVKRFVKSVEKGKFIDPKGSPCDTCVDEQQFTGCHDCVFGSDDYSDEELADLEDEGGLSEK